MTHLTLEDVSKVGACQLNCLGGPRSESLRIGMFTPNYPGVTSEGGIGTYTRQQAQMLASLGHEVHVLVPHAGAESAIVNGVHVHTVPTRHVPIADRIVPGLGAMLHVHNAASRLVDRYNLQVFEFANWDGFGALFAARKTIPIVVRLATSALETQVIDGLPRNWKLRWDVRREHLLGRNANVLVTHSDCHRQMMASELRMRPDSIQLIPLGVDTFPDFRRRASEADPIVLFVGRMERRKGTLDLIRAIPGILKAHARTRFVFIGADRPHCPGGQLHGDYIRQHLSDEARRKVALLGRLTDAEVASWMQRATVFVAPSLYESFGLVFLEAMRWGTPVVGTRVGGIPEIVEDGTSGVLVSPEDPQALEEAISKLLANEVLQRRLGESGRLRVEEHFSIQRQAMQMLALYKSLLCARTARRVS